VFFFILLVIFAMAFFGAFELTLPSKWVECHGQKNMKKAVVCCGVFFMALTLVLVSFSCTGPIIGANCLLVMAASSSNFISPSYGNVLDFYCDGSGPYRFHCWSFSPSWLNPCQIPALE
jgi:thiol:disulfide interchange protein DsbD